MTVAACAEIVRKGDPDRFLAVMAAPVAARKRLFPLYAFNLEVARAPWVTKEPLIAEMRLQWWRDVVANAASGAARAHEVAGPLHAVIRAADLPLTVLDRLIAARRWDIGTDPFADEAALDAYLDDTAGGLMWLAVRALGGTDEARARDAGRAAGLAAYLRAAPELAARGRPPLVDDNPAAIARRAREGLARLQAARGLRSPALLSAWLARPVLRRAAADPAAVAEGRLAPSEFIRRGRLLWCAATGRV
jgi:phytoene/squalene synthetase